MVRTTVFFVVVSLLLGCSVVGQVVMSKGAVEGWEIDGFKNYNEDIEIYFEVDNKFYISHHEQFIGIKTKDRSSNALSPVGSKPFSIVAKLRSNKGKFRVKKFAYLILDDEQYIAVGVESGIDSIKSGRLIDVSDGTGDFIVVKEFSGAFDHNWIKFTFDIAVPNPSTIFNFSMTIEKDGLPQKLNIKFSPFEKQIFHTN